MPKSQRVKGHSFERFVAKDIRSIFGDPSDEVLHKIIKRGLQSRNNSDKVEDVICPAFSIECKAYKANPPIKKAMRQAQETARLYDKVPVVVIKEDRIPPFVVLNYDDFIGLIGDFINYNLGPNVSLHEVDIEEFSERLVKKIKNGFNSVKLLRDPRKND